MSLPTNQEQEMFERVNRLRMDPAGEFARLILDAATKTAVTSDITTAIRYFNVDMAMLQQQMAAYGPVAPLAWNNQLEESAAYHSGQMIAADTQAHQLPGEASVAQRIANAGYSGAYAVSENIFAYSRSPIYGHAGFVIDWGNGPGGMQNPAGHRVALMSSNYKEIGIDISQVTGAKIVGPQVITQDMGSRSGYVPQVLGVVFGDGDADGFYDAGEGRGGVTVTLSGSAGTFTTTTWSSGGYQIAVPQGNYTLTFSGGGLTQSYASSATLGTANIKIDLNTAIAVAPTIPVKPSVPDLAVVSDAGESSVDNLTNVTAPVFTGTGTPSSTITLYADGNQVGTGTVGANGTWSVTASTLTAGSHTITARASNTAGSSATTAALTIQIDNAAPAAPSTPDLAPNSDSGVAGTDNITRIVTPFFTGVAEANATVMLRDGATVIGTTKASATGAWTIKSITLSDGLHQISALATDAAGNISSPSGAVAIRIDSTGAGASVAPTLAVACDTGRSNTDAITNDTAPIFNGVGEVGSTVQLHAGGVLIGSTIVGSDGTWSARVSPLADGKYNVVSRFTDIAGNNSVLSAPLLVKVDTAAPVLPLLTTATTTRITGSAEALAQVQVFDAGQLVNAVIAGTDGRWSLSATLAAGVHSLAVRASDLAGNTSPIASSFTAQVGSIGGDVMNVMVGANLTAGGIGDDTYMVGDARGVVMEAVAEGTDTIIASVGYTLPTGSEIEFLQAAAGATGLALTGNEIANTIAGGAGNDTITGMRGSDTLYGGLGADRFVYLACNDSTAALAGRDTIADFNVAQGDLIDIATLDANTTVLGDQGFAFIGSNAFSGAAGELRCAEGQGFMLLMGDTNGDGVANFGIRLDGAQPLTSASFVL